MIPEADGPREYTGEFYPVVKSNAEAKKAES